MVYLNLILFFLDSNSKHILCFEYNLEKNGEIRNHIFDKMGKKRNFVKIKGVGVSASAIRFLRFLIATANLLFKQLFKCNSANNHNRGYNSPNWSPNTLVITVIKCNSVEGHPGHLTKCCPRFVNLTLDNTSCLTCQEPAA